MSSLSHHNPTTTTQQKPPPADHHHHLDQDHHHDFHSILQDCANRGDWDGLRSYLDSLSSQSQSVVVHHATDIFTGIQAVLFVPSSSQEDYRHDHDVDDNKSRPPPVDILQRLYYMTGCNKDILTMRHVVTGECLLSYWIQCGLSISQPVLEFLQTVAPELVWQTHRYDDEQANVIQVLTRQYGVLLQHEYDWRLLKNQHEPEHCFWDMAYHIVHMMIQTTTSTAATSRTTATTTSSSSSSSSPDQHKDNVVVAIPVKTPQQDMLRTCLRIYQYLPQAFLQLVLQHYWEQLSEPDETGRYPLHLLCATSPFDHQSSSRRPGHYNNYKKKDSWLLQQIVQGYPYAASIAAPSSSPCAAAAAAAGQQEAPQVQFPLQLALKSGRRLGQCAGMQALVSCYPQALFPPNCSTTTTTTSTSTTTAPVVPEPPERHRSNMSDGWMVTQLASQQRAPTVVFEILRSNPDVMGMQ